MNRRIDLNYVVGILSFFLFPAAGHSTTTPSDSVHVNYGDFIQASIGSPGEKDSYTFEAQAGDVIIIRMNRTSGGINPYLELFGTSGSRLTSQGSPYPYDRAQILDLSLPAPGTYTIVASDDNGNETGSYALSLQSTNRPGNAEAIAYGSLAQDTLIVETQMSVHQFQAQSGDRVIVRMNRTSGGMNPYLELFGTNGSRLNSEGSPYPYDRAQIVDVSLPTTGTYTIMTSDDNGNETGGYALSLQCTNRPGNAEAITYGSLVQNAFALETQMKVYQFQAQAGDLVIVRMNRTTGGSNPYLELFSPDGRRINSQGSPYPYDRAQILDQSLSTTGLYTIVVSDDNGNETGGYTLSLQSTNRPGNAEATTYGLLVQDTLIVETQMSVYQFQAQSGDRVIIRMNRTSGGVNPYLELFGTNGSRLSSEGSPYPYDRAEIVDFSLPTTGTYTILVSDDNGNEIGGYALSLQCTNRPGNPEAIVYGSLAQNTLALETQMKVYQFQVQAGDFVIIRMNRTTGGMNPYLELFDPNGNRINSQGSPYPYDRAEILDQVLSANGLYTMVASDDNGNETGGYALSLQSTNRPGNAETIAYDSSLQHILSAETEMKVYKFQAQSADRIIVNMNRTSGGVNPYLELFRSNGMRLTSEGSPYPYDHAQILDFSLSTTDTYAIFASDDNGNDKGSYLLTLQAPRPLTLDERLENQQLLANGEDKWYRVISSSYSPVVVQVDKSTPWNATLRVKKGSLPLTQPYFSDAGADDLEVAFIAAEADTYYVQVESNSNGGQYSILATSDLTHATKTLALDNDVVNAKISIRRAAVMNLMFKAGSNAELIEPQQGAFLIDLGSDPRLGKYLDKDWTVRSAELQESYLSLSLRHASGFANNLVLSWSNDRIEARYDVTAPEAVVTHSILRPGGSWQSGRDKWAFPASAGVQTGSFSYPGNLRPLYPADNSWGTPSEGWLALWDDQVNEVVGFTFSGGFKAKIGNGAGADIQFLFPVGTSRLAFHVSIPKPATPYEGIRDLASGPFLTLTNQVDKLFVAAGNELIYTLIYSNTGNEDATDVVIEDVLSSEVDLVDGSISNGGTYDPTSKRITWNIGPLIKGAKKDTVTLMTRIHGTVINGTQISNFARIMAAEQSIATTAFITTIVASPFVNSVSPNKSGNTGAVTLLIEGENLDPHAEIRLQKDGQDDIVASIVSGQMDGKELSATFDLKGVKPNAYELIIINPNGVSAKYQNGFVVESGGRPKLWAEILGRRQMRVGRPNPLQIQVGNSGEMDAWAYALKITLPSNIFLDLDIPFSQDPLPGQEYLHTGSFNPDTSILFIYGHHLSVGQIEEINIVITPQNAGDDQITIELFSDLSEFDSTRVFQKQISNRQLLSQGSIIHTLYLKTWYPPSLVPPEGSIVIRLSKGGGSGHVGIYVGDGKVVDIVPAKDVSPFSEYDGVWRLVDLPSFWHEGEGGEGQYVGAWAPPNLSSETAERIKSEALKKVGEPVKFNVPSFGDYKDCVEGVYDIYNSEGVELPPWWNKREILSPAEIYERSSGHLWPEWRGPWWLLAPSSWSLLLPFPFGAVKAGLSFLMAIDPNEKSGRAGFDAEGTPDSLQNHFIRSGPVPYIVYFENLQTATAAAQEVLIIDSLDINLNWSSFAFGEMQIGERLISVPREIKSFDTKVDLRPSLATVVEVKGLFDANKGIASWLLRGINPYTGELADMLPPNTQGVSPRGQGWVSYRIESKQSLATGTIIRNKATIDFEVGIPPAPLETPEVFNTIDADKPTSRVLPFAAVQDSAHFRVKWSGSDVGAGNQDYTIFVSKENGPYTAWLQNMIDTTAVFNGEPNKTYAFYSVARDNVGNIEDAPNEPDAKTKAGQLTSVSEPDDNLPKTFSLSQNYPNPFNPSTSIHIEVPKASHLTIKIYDLLGRAVRTLVDRRFEAGRYVEIWDGRDERGKPVTSGIYFIRMQVEGFVRVKKSMLIR